MLNRYSLKPLPCVLGTLAVGLLCSVASASDFPGGFLEKPDQAATRPLLTRPELLDIIPERGKFTFPAPYSTTANRLTTDEDCDGRDCVNHVGYAYWNNINNHIGSDTMLIFVGLDRKLGGAGPTLLQYNKVTDEVENRGLLFDDSNPLSWGAGEGWYFSSTLPHALYVNSGPVMYRYDVIRRVEETVFDIRTELGSGYSIWQMHSSADDRVHSATVLAEGSGAALGCVAYREDTDEFHYYPSRGAYDECQVDKSGKWLLIKENVDGQDGEDNRIINLDTLEERLLPDSAGAAGHSDMGYGYMIASDNWADKPNTQKLWKFDAPVLTGTSVYHNADWNVAAPSHVSHGNARPDIAAEQQYACGSSSNHGNSAEANEIVCFGFDGSDRALVVAPVMTDLDAGGGGDAYEKTPKGNLDVSGQYFIWTSNLGGPRLDLFLVKVPAHLLTGGTRVMPPVVLPRPLPDVGAPVLGNIDLVDLGATSLRINWTTNEGAEDMIQYGIGSVRQNSSTVNETFVTAHSRKLDNLVPGTQYLYRVLTRDADGNVTASPYMTFTTSPASDEQLSGSWQDGALSWASPINAEAYEGTLVKTGGCEGCPDAGAASIQEIDDGSGYVEFTVDDAQKMLFFGLSKTQPGTYADQIDFALRVQGRYVEVRENGVYEADIRISAGDVLGIAVLDGAVSYLLNGMIFHTSMQTPAMPLRTYATLYDNQSSVDSARIVGL